MKIICVNNKYIVLAAGNIGSTPELIEGEEYTALEETEYGYHLVEIASRSYYGFDKKRFIKLSNIDETKFERNYNKELA